MQRFGSYSKRTTRDGLSNEGRSWHRQQRGKIKYEVQIQKQKDILWESTSRLIEIVQKKCDEYGDKVEIYEDEIQQKNS